jgi:hypothetical protein
MDDRGAGIIDVGKIEPVQSETVPSGTGIEIIKKQIAGKQGKSAEQQRQRKRTTHKSSLVDDVVHDPEQALM